MSNQGCLRSRLRRIDGVGGAKLTASFLHVSVLQCLSLQFQCLLECAFFSCWGIFGLVCLERRSRMLLKCCRLCWMQTGGGLYSQSHGPAVMLSALWWIGWLLSLSLSLWVLLPLLVSHPHRSYLSLFVSFFLTWSLKWRLSTVKLSLFHTHTDMNMSLGVLVWAKSSPRGTASGVFFLRLTCGARWGEKTKPAGWNSGPMH